MDYEIDVNHFFSNLGYHVEKIPESSVESPDFLVYDDSVSYLVELKTKFPSMEQIAERKSTLETGEIHSIQESITYQNRLHGIIKKAVGQLDEHKDKIPFRLIWLLSTDYLAEPRMLQFKSTIYGIACVVDVSQERPGDCYFFYNSDFYRYRSKLDSAIISTDMTNPVLLLNPLSARYENLKSSSLIKHFDNALIDPYNLDLQGKAFLVDSDVDRGNEEAVLQYLREKYKSENFVKLSMNYLSGTMRI
jgi:hypothetical protein